MTFFKIILMDPKQSEKNRYRCVNESIEMHKNMYILVKEAEIEATFSVELYLYIY